MSSIPLCTTISDIAKTIIDYDTFGNAHKKYANFYKEVFINKSLYLWGK